MTNEFTKKELEIIIGWWQYVDMDQYGPRYPEEEAIDNRILAKIHAMIKALNEPKDS